MNIIVNVKNKDIKDLLITAIESGSGYWVRCYHVVESAPSQSDNFYAKFMPPERWMSFVVNDSGKKIMLTWERVRQGLTLMAKKYPEHFGAFMGASYDATTADVFLQLCLLGEVVYA